MAGFFSLGGSGRGGGRRGGGEDDDDDDNRGQQNQPPPPPPFPHENWFWYRSDENPYKGFELWQHQQHHQQQELYHQQQRLNLYSPAAGLASGGSSMNVSDESSSRSAAAYMSMRPSGSGSSSGSISCQDCGNQAKKDCAHMRCRTCCKSRGFDCRTHVRSTWVPVSKRRERQQQLAALHQQQQQEQQDEEQEHRRLVEFPKRHKETPASTSGLEVGDFPAEVRTEAAFRCVRVSSIDNIDEAQVAYQTSVNIGGHLFKGILYDQGPDNNQSIYNVPPRETSGDRDGDDGSGGGGATGATSTGGGGSYVDPSSFYPTPLNTFMSGTQFFPNEPRS